MTEARCDFPGCVYVEGWTAMCRGCFGVFCLSHLHRHDCPATPTVAALYVDPAGVYANLPGVEVWDEARDARTYAGPWPVVAHPPCNRWSSLAFLNRALHGYEIGADGGCFAAALAAVRAFGGVLEHPAGSLAWKRYELPRPSVGGWWGTLLDGGWVTEVEQATYGHRARKRTWLYYVGPEPAALDWRSVDVAAKVSSFNHRRRGEYVPDEASRVRPREASATPPAFRDVLLAMARSAARPLDKEKGEHLGSPVV